MRVSEASFSSGGIGPTAGAGREIRLTARYGAHPYQPIVAQAQQPSEVVSTSELRDEEVHLVAQLRAHTFGIATQVRLLE